MSNWLDKFDPVHRKVIEAARAFKHDPYPDPGSTLKQIMGAMADELDRKEHALTSDDVKSIELLPFGSAEPTSVVIVLTNGMRIEADIDTAEFNRLFPMGAAHLQEIAVWVFAKLGGEK
jgi:hypothetical protein